MAESNGTVNVAGTKMKKNTAMMLGAVGLGVIGYGVYRSKKAATTSASTTASVNPSGSGYGSTSYPADGTTGNPSDPYSTDPSTGQTYGDEQSSGFGGYGGVNSGYGMGGSGGYSSGFGSGGFSPGFGALGNGTTTTPTFTDNASWAQYAESYLVGLGGDANTIGNALGKYITGQPVTSTQQSTIEQAIAFANQPPVSGSGGFPPSIHLATSGGSGGGGNINVPHVVGMSYTAGAAVIKAAGLVPHRGETNVGTITSQSPAAGTSVASGSVVTLSGKGSGGGTGGGTGVGHHVPKRVIMSTGAFDLHTIAQQNGVTEHSLVSANPSLAQFSGSGHHIPKGVRITIPAHTTN